MKRALGLLIVSLFMLSPLLLNLPSASAQGAGHWVLTVDNNGSTSYFLMDPTGTWTFDQSWYRMAEGADATVPFDSDTTFAAMSSGTAKIRAVWLNSQNLPAPYPPSKAYVRIWPWASWRISSLYLPAIQGLNHAAVDGNGDAEQLLYSQGYPYKGNSQPVIVIDPYTSFPLNLLLKLDGSSGTATKDIMMSAMLSFHSDAPGYAGANCDLAARVLNFDARISSSLDPTYHREMQNNLPVRVANALDSKGEMHADSSVRNGNVTATFSAGLSGDWSANSTYHWYSEAKDYASNGSFTLPYSLPDPLINTYTGDDSKGERVDLHLTDTATGYDTHTDYYIKFHGEYENWTKTNGVKHPADFVHGKPNPEWYYIFKIHNPSNQPLEQDLGHEFSLKLTMTGEISGKQALDPEGIAAFELNEKITIGAEVTGKYTATQKFIAPPWTDSDFFAGLSWEDRYGTVSGWDAHGYAGDSPWHGVYVSPALSLAIDPRPLPQPAPANFSPIH